MLSVDLQDAYFHIPINQDFQKSLRFALGGQNFQFVCLPFGLTQFMSVFQGTSFHWWP